MPKSKAALSIKDNEKLYQMWHDGDTYHNGKPYTLTFLAKFFNRNKARILKELHYWKGYQRFVAAKEPVIKMDPVSMEEVEKEYGENS